MYKYRNHILSPQPHPTPDPAADSADSEISFDGILPALSDEEAPELTDIIPTLHLNNPSTPTVQPLPPQPVTQYDGPSTSQPGDDAGTLPVPSAPLPPSQQLADGTALSAQAPLPPSQQLADGTARSTRRRRKTTLSSECDSMKNSYVKALHLANNDHPFADALKNCGMSRTAFYRYKYIAELQIVDREHFSNLFNLAISSTPQMTKQTFAQACIKYFI